MNCDLCKKELEAYREGRLPEGIEAQVKDHLESCEDCATVYHLESLANRVMNEEIGLASNPFLITRIMAGIDALEQKRESHQHIPAYQKVLKPLLISVSLAAAVFVGVIAGSIYKPTHSISNVPVEMSYMNDAAIESVDMFATSK